MRKVGFVLLGALFLFMACGPKQIPIVEKVPMPEDKPLYGYTVQGIFFLHHALFENTSGETPIVAVETSGYRGRNMQRQGEYYVYDVHRASKDLSGFQHYMSREMEVHYYFPIGKGRMIPDIIWDQVSWIPEKDLFFSGRDRKSAVFSTDPVENPYLQEE